MLKNRFGEADIFKSNKLQRAIDYAASNEHINKLFSPSKVDRDSDLRCNKFSFMNMLLDIILQLLNIRMWPLS